MNRVLPATRWCVRSVHIRADIENCIQTGRRRQPPTPMSLRGAKGLINSLPNIHLPSGNYARQTLVGQRSESSSIIAVTSPMDIGQRVTAEYKGAFSISLLLMMECIPLFWLTKVECGEKANTGKLSIVCEPLDFTCCSVKEVEVI